MSGGAYDYQYSTIRHEYVGRMHDAELNDMMEDLADLLYELEWWQSGDTSEDRYRKCVKEFKNTWMRRSKEDVSEFYKSKLLKYARDLVDEMQNLPYEEGM